MALADARACDVATAADRAATIDRPGKTKSLIKRPFSSLVPPSSPRRISTPSALDTAQTAGGIEERHTIWWNAREPGLGVQFGRHARYSIELMGIRSLGFSSDTYSRPYGGHAFGAGNL
jgi:hypothetical protein